MHPAGRHAPYTLHPSLRLAAPGRSFVPISQPLAEARRSRVTFPGDHWEVVAEPSVSSRPSNYTPHQVGAVPSSPLPWGSQRPRHSFLRVLVTSGKPRASVSPVPRRLSHAGEELASSIFALAALLLLPPSPRGRGAVTDTRPSHPNSFMPTRLWGRNPTSQASQPLPMGRVPRSLGLMTDRPPRPEPRTWAMSCSAGQDLQPDL